MHRYDAIIVGAGLAGLTCAAHLHRAGYDILVLEASDDVGGRVRTDVVDGFRLDRGFQVLLTAYPETRSELDYGALRLGQFSTGAMVHLGGSFYRVADPLRNPSWIRATLKAPIGTLQDKLRVGWMRAALSRGTIDDIFARPEVSTAEALRQRWGFSEQMIERFFRPFVGGITLDPELTGSSQMFEFVMRMFIEGEAALPADGMGAIPRQLYEALPKNVVRLGQRVRNVEMGRLVTETEASYGARAIVLATHGPESERLSGRPISGTWKSATCIYFVADQPPFTDPVLMLNGERRGSIMNVSVQSNAAPSYSPDSRALIAVVPYTPRGEDEPIDDIRGQLIAWFGGVAERWQHLRTYHIPYALPEGLTISSVPIDRQVRLRERLYVCGDHRSTPSINGAMASGRHAARAVAADLRRTGGAVRRS